MPTSKAPPPRPWHPDSKCLQYVYPDTERPGAYYVEVQCGQVKKALRANAQVLLAICARFDPFRNVTELAALTMPICPIFASPMAPIGRRRSRAGRAACQT